MKYAVVTGASTGIGRRLAKELARNDYHVFLLARNVEGLQQTLTEIETDHGHATVIPTDLSSVTSINEAIQQITQVSKKIDFLANIAGIWHGQNEVYAGKDFATFQQEVIVNTLFVGTIAPMILIHSLLPRMSSGTIVNLSGTFENGAKGWLPYYVSKKAIEDLTVGLAQELAETDIAVFGISPSDTATEMYKKYFPEYISEAIDPEEIALFILKLCMDQADCRSGKIFVMKQGKAPYEAFHV